MALVGIAWQLATARGAVNPLLLPAPAAVYREFLTLLRTAAFWPDLKVTLLELAIAFAIAAVAGSATGYLVSRSRYADPRL